MRKIFLIFIFLSSVALQAQELSNLRNSTMSANRDTIVVDSLSLIPGSVDIFYQNGQPLDTNAYTIHHASSEIILDRKMMQDDSLEISYRVFPLSFSKPFSHKKFKQVEKEVQTPHNPFAYKYSNEARDILNLGGLNKSGSISRGINVGNNQDLSVNSNMNLQLSGKISEDINILAAVSDDNIPIQPEGNTQQLQDFDQVYIQLFDDKSKLTAGDFFLKKPKSYFMVYNKRAQGGRFSTSFPVGDHKTDTSTGKRMDLQVSGAISKGKFARNIIKGVEGNQGPYRLRGNENESFIIVLSGTEKVYLDGKLMRRGQDYDYIIDYNTAELTFTPSHLINQNSRIVVEFQYSDKNYARSLVQFSDEYSTEKLNLRMNIYSEQDAKNQPLQQDLTTEQKTILANVGDSTEEAISNSITPVDEFIDDQVLYKMVDSLGYDSVLVHSTHPDSAKFRASFSPVGENNGNYEQVKSLANGKVFRWVPPDTNFITGRIIPQGNYAPVVKLIAPKQRQMLTFGGDYKLGKTSIVSFETAVSNNDLNTFSNQHSNDDIGYAFKVNLDNEVPLDTSEKPLLFTGGGGYEQVEKNFNQIERFRSVEFDRDWNVRNLKLTKNQFLGNAYAGIKKRGKGFFRYDFNTYISQSEYEGLKNSIKTVYNNKGWNLDLKGSYLETKGETQSTNYLRHYGTLSKGLGWARVGIYEEHERNLFSLPDKDTLLNNSFEWRILKGFIQNADTTDSKYELSYQYRENLKPFDNKLTLSSIAEDINLGFDLAGNPKSRLSGKATYRRLRIIDSLIAQNEPENTMLGRLQYNLRAIDGLVTSNTYYEIGSGLEVKKDFSYLEVNTGQGVYTWTDYNDNGVKELNEFEVAAFRDQANYIKVFTPTNQYVRTYSNQFNQLLFIKPEALLSNKKGLLKLLSKLSNKAAYRTDRKTGNEEDLYSPFPRQITDSSLITLNSSFQNTFYINRTGRVFSIDLNYRENRSKSLLTNGFEAREDIYQSGNFRWNISRKFTLNGLYKEGVKTNSSEFFTNRNYNLNYTEIEPKISYQPGVSFRLSLFFNYKEKVNDEEMGGESVFIDKAGTELRYNKGGKGSFLASFNFIQINYNGTSNTSLAYEMLEGLQPGQNMTWSLSYQRNLSDNMQLSLNYNGRKSEEVKTIHSGGVQVRAYF